MKKIFLPLLAAVGIALGFTLTSCGGGGGSEKGNAPVRALAGIVMEETSLWPSFKLTFVEFATGEIIETVLELGEGNRYSCFYSLKDSPKRKDGVWKFEGNIGGVRTVQILKDNNFLALIGVNQAASSCVLETFKLNFDIPSGATGRYASTGQIWVAGRYFVTGNETEGSRIDFDERQVTFKVEGKLHEEWLSDSTEEEEEDKPFDY